jgi:hypothetical protein
MGYQISSNDKVVICIKCKQEKPQTEDYFCRNSDRLSGFLEVCKICDNERQRIRRANWSKETRKDRLKKKSEYASTKGKPGQIKMCYTQIDQRKGLLNDLTKSFIKNALEQTCAYCGFESTGLDRLDNSKGHLQSNCIPCCKECNIARLNHFSYSEMLIIGKAIREVKLSRIINNN